MTMRWLVLVALTGCVFPAAQCKVASVDIYPAKDKPKPAGKIAVKCDGKPVVDIEANDVRVGGK